MHFGHIVELEQDWITINHRTIIVIPLRSTDMVITDATEITLLPNDNLYSQETLLPLLKVHFKNRLFIKGNELVYWHYGKKIYFKICQISSSNYNDNSWFRLTGHTNLRLKTDDNNKSEENTCLGGAEDTIEELESLVKTALDRDKTVLSGLPPPRGILLFGHSGTGKTSICRHVIKKLGYHHVIIEGPAIFSKYYGETEKTLSSLFKDAISNEPSIIFADDVDTICPRSASASTEQEKRVTGAFLSGLDSLHLNDSRVFVMATAAKSDSLDPGLRRAGRLDREIEVAVPDRTNRRKLLKCLLDKICHQLTGEEIDIIADAAHGYVAADILNLCAQASTHRVRDKFDVSEKKLRLQDLKYALTVVKASAMREVLVEVPNVKWSDIGGQDDLKLQLKQAVEWPLKHADRFESLGIEPPSGILMYGPPGCSKTLIAKALATESGLNFLSIKGPELFSKWVGESERAVRELFARARRVAPAVVFFDELDALGGERGVGEAGGVKERVLAQLLTELDGVVPLRGVLILGATNRPDRIDRALLRPGRLDRLVYVPLPDKYTRADIFRIKLSKVPLSADVVLDSLVEKTEGFSGAEVQAVCHEAVLKALDEDINCQNVHSKHFELVLHQFKPRTPKSLLSIYEKFASNR